jgi:WD40 repeat protein
MTADVERLFLFALTVNPSARASVWWRFLYPGWRNQFIARNPWKPATGDEDWRDDVPLFEPRASHFSRDGQVIALFKRLANIGSVVHWPSNETLFQASEFLLAAHFLPDGESLMLVSLVSAIGSQDQSAPRYRLSRWNFKTRSESPGIVWTEAFPDEGKHLHSIAFSSDGRYLAESPQPGIGPPYGALIRDTTTGEIRFKDADTSWFTLAKDGRMFVTTRTSDLGEPELHITDIESLRTERLVLYGRYGDPVIEGSPNGRLLATAIDQDTSSVLYRWPALYQFLISLGFESDSEQREVAVVDVKTCRELITLPHGPSNIYANGWYMQSVEPQMVFSPDSSRLAVLGTDAIRIWDLPPRRSCGMIFTLPLIPALPIALLGVWRRSRSAPKTPRRG